MLGTGFITTAAKKEQCPPEVLERAIASMVQLNEVGREALRASGGAHGVTDITGFGLAGHAAEMADASGVTLAFEVSKLPVIEGAAALADARFHTRASKANRAYVADRVQVHDTADPLGIEFAFDAQTSGGLLIAVADDRAEQLVAELGHRGALAAARIGRVTARQGQLAVVLA